MQPFNATLTHLDDGKGYDTLMSSQLTEEDEDYLPFKWRERLGKGLFSDEPPCPSGAQRGMKIPLPLGERARVRGVFSNEIPFLGWEGKRQKRSKKVGISNERGITLIELIIVILILSIIAGGLSQLLAGGLMNVRENRGRSVLIDDANYAMNRMVEAARETNWVFIPTNASPVRDILAVSAMVDNDNDNVVDEDWGVDIGNDGQAGLAGFDDDGDGSIDEGAANDDDEDGAVDEDSPENRIDDDSDGNYDEEFQADINGDGCPGMCARDEDGDGLYDEGNIEDDDEDGLDNEDPVDPLIFYLQNGSIYEKRIIWNPDTGLSDITDKKLLDNVSQFRVERLMGLNGTGLIKIRIELSRGKGSAVMLESDVYPRMLPVMTP